uniref:Uncharacterized protein n=1 Tax=Oryza sativa subsp. japonica TaxID=39947 RepID=Q6ZCQ8_ORYSJ|nr:hypothetical protein [Oryza sativa Japonica Group]
MPLLLLPSSTSDKDMRTDAPPARLCRARLIGLHLRSPSSPPPPDDPVVALHAIRAANTDAVEARPHGGVVGAHGHGEGAAALEQLLHSALVALPLGAVVIGNLVVSLTAAPTSCRRGGGGDGSNGRGGGTGRGAMGGVPAGACGLGFSMEESSREGNKLGLAF